MHERASSSRSKTVDHIAKKGLRWLAPGSLAVMVLAMEACYSPDFGSSIYRCEGYSCPGGLVCNSDSLCVRFPEAGCTNGGLSVGNGVFLCPGIKNSCQMGYSVCPTPPMGLACTNVNSDLGVFGRITGESIPCSICCPM